MESEVANCQCPVEDCKLAVDIVLKSSDGELFQAHQRNLEIYTEGFPIAGSTVASDPVSLEETGEVLRLMLRYTHHIRLPNLDSIPFTLLTSLAEAVEKYMIYSAMESCRIQMMLATYDHPNEVFFYSVKHNYPDLADKAAKLTVKNPSSDFVGLIRATFQDDVAVRWLRYRDGWIEILVQLAIFPEPGCHHDLTPEPECHHQARAHCQCRGFGQPKYCSVWLPFQFKTLNKVNSDLGVLDNFSDIVKKEQAWLGNCSTCVSHSFDWASDVRNKIEKLPEYSKAI